VTAAATDLLASPSPSSVVALAMTFPSLRSAPGLHPWSARTFREWSFGALVSAPMEARHAAKFILEVWDGKYPGSAFRAVDAMTEWDDAHRAAFLAWCRAPWRNEVKP